MVRNYIRKTTRGSWSEDSMRNALLERYCSNTSFRELAKKYNVPSSTLRRHAAGVLKKASGTKHLGRSSTYNDKNEDIMMMAKYYERNQNVMTKYNEKHENVLINKYDEKDLVSYNSTLERTGSQLTNTNFEEMGFENVNMQNINWYDWMRLVNWISIKTFGRSYIEQAAITANSEVN
uniref:uncharacterized protein LOC100187313 isoform X2 n=1 Tax=Ciona intestinalis TaxID=7719 RepID=UPI000EF4D0FB|nr:uncharacterized protein LOC100187313 isoform X2 [Ciona intestinalis]|eukprot:XP_026689726.1 uncharacterized protein LOC100187313 isoform X2 [Ciona intestinalis]